MTNAIRWYQMLGLVNRAGKLISGEELTLREIKNQRAKLVVLSEDASATTEKRIKDKCTFYKVPIVRVPNRELLGNAIGKSERVVLVVLDEGFANKIQSYFN